MKAEAFKGEVSANKLARFRKIGFYLLLVDYLFIGYILLRIISIDSVFSSTVNNKFHIAITYYMIPVFGFPFFLLLYIILRINSDYLKEQVIDKRNKRDYSFKISIVPAMIALLFSSLFADTIREYIPKLPIELQANALLTYYLSYVIMIIYFFIRTLFSFDYYQSFYVTDKNDKKYLFVVGWSIFLVFTMHLFPYHVFFMF